VVPTDGNVSAALGPFAVDVSNLSVIVDGETFPSGWDASWFNANADFSFEQKWEGVRQAIGWKFGLYDPSDCPTKGLPQPLGGRHGREHFLEYADPIVGAVGAIQATRNDIPIMIIQQQYNVDFGCGWEGWL
jgi:hypothetical protein